jgi:hypothetical protein
MKTEHPFEPFPEDIQVLLDAEREAVQPSEAVRQRVFESVEQSIRTGAPVMHGGELAATGGPMWTWIVAGILVVGAGVGIGMSGDETARPPERKPVVAEPPAPEVSSQSRSIRSAVLKSGTPVVKPAVVSSSAPSVLKKSKGIPMVLPAESKRFQPKVVTGGSTDEKPSVASVPTPTVKAPQTKKKKARPAQDLRAERVLLEKARTALSVGQGKRALRFVRRHRRTYPQGLLVEERQSLMVQILVRLGHRDKAKAKAKAFVKSFPRSGHRKEVEKAASGGDK